MKRIIVASHGPLSRAIIESAALIASENAVKNIYSISVTMDTSHDEVIREVNKVFNEFDQNDEILALTDVYGGSITTVISEYIGIRSLHIITGINLGMLLETIFMLDQMEISELIEHLMQCGKDGIRYVNEELYSSEGEEI